MNNATLHDTNAEQALLGALICRNNILDDLPENFRAHHFAAELHSLIYEAIHKIRNLGRVADPITLSSHLQKHKIFIDNGGQKYLLSLVSSVISFVNVNFYADIIRELYMRRAIIGIAARAEAKARDFDSDTTPTDVIENTEMELYNLAGNEALANQAIIVGKAIAEAIEIAELAIKKGRTVSGVTTGFRQIDKRLGGFHGSDLYIIAGRPSMGKTAFATNIAFKVALAKLHCKSEGAGVIFFSLEMSAVELARRILAHETGITSDSIKRGEITKDTIAKFIECSQTLENLELYIEDAPDLTINSICANARRAMRKHNIGLIVIDYLQLIKLPTTKKYASRTEEIGEITRAMKGLARGLNVPVLALSQLSRAVEQRDDKRPQLSDLRESGSIEQDADVVMFIFREAYYKAGKEPTPNTPEHDKWLKEMEKIHNLAEIIIAKQRHGPTGTVRLYFDGSTTKFGNLME